MHCVYYFTKYLACVFSEPFPNNFCEVRMVEWADSIKNLVLGIDDCFTFFDSMSLLERP